MWQREEVVDRDKTLEEQIRKKERKRATNKKWRENNPEKARANSKKWRENNLQKAREREKKWRENNSQKVKEYFKKWHKKFGKEYRKTRKEKDRNYFLKHKYGITLLDFNNLVLKQQSKCKLCERIKKLVVDHDHKTGKMRGLLCNHCNIWLGVFENESFMKRLANYL